MKKYIYSLLFVILSLGYIIPAFAANDLSNAFNAGNLNTVREKAGYSDISDPNSAIDPIISSIINIALSFLGVIFLGITIYAGYLWMTAQGDSKKVDEAKDMLKRAVVGLIVVVSAYAISGYVIESFAGLGLDDNSTGMSDVKNPE